MVTWIAHVQQDRDAEVVRELPGVMSVEKAEDSDADNGPDERFA